MKTESAPAGSGGVGEDKTPSRGLVRFWPIAALALATALAFAFGLHRYLSLEHVIEKREALAAFVARHGVWAIGGYMAVYFGAVALSLPGGLVLTVLGGFLFGWLVGALAALVAATLGACAVFLIARTSLAGPLAERAGPSLKRLQEGFRRDAVSYLLFLRLVPAFPFWLVNLAPSLLGVPFRLYVVTTIVGVLPATFAFAVAGAGLDGFAVAQRAAYAACVASGGPDCQMFRARDLLTTQIVVAFAALAVVALIPIVVRRVWRGKFASLDDRDPVA